MFRCLLVVWPFFSALLHNHCCSLHKTKSRMVTSIWQGPGPVATKMPLFRRNSSLLQFFSAPTQEGNLLFLSKRSAQKELYNFPIRLSHLCWTSRHVWLSSSSRDRCCAYQLICIMKISTYTTGARTEMTRLLGSCTVKKWALSRLAPSVMRVVIWVSRAFCSTDQEKRETARSLICRATC